MKHFPSLTGRRRRVRNTVLLASFALVTAAALPMTAYASHPEVSLAGSNFEIDTDANLKVDDPAPSLDWANVTETRKADTISGPTDESFGNGTKEDTAVPSIVDGSIPPNKSDLKFFGLYQEGGTSTGFLNLFWSRVQEPVGTTNMDFEFNQSKTASANGVTPVRTAGDLLIIYDLSQGGTHPTLSLRTWNGSSWGSATDLTDSSKATGSINTSAIPDAESAGLGPQSSRTFGEAQIALSAIFTDPTICQSFGSAYLKSRSSDSFTAALKDFVPPVSIDISNCGSVNIHKQDDAGNPLAGAVFQLYKDNAPVGGSRGAEDTAVAGKTCTTGADGNCTISNVLAGEYWVVETTTPAGHETAPDQHVTVGADTTVTLTFVDPRQRGAIRVHKTAKNAAAGGVMPQAGVAFTIAGQAATTDANGNACVDGLLFGSYNVTETVPTGYHAAGDTTKSVTVDNKATCGSDPYNGETVNFVNVPLTNITLSVDSQIDGGTASTIDCGGGASGNTGANGDGSVSRNNLEPGTYTCTVVIDP